jgi:hypothetical protein
VIARIDHVQVAAPPGGEPVPAFAIRDELELVRAL